MEAPARPPAGRERFVRFALVALWIAASANAFLFVARYASPIAVLDDVEFLQPFLPGYDFWRVGLWQAANEHQVTLVRVVLRLAMAVVLDVRVGMYLQVAALSATAWIAMRCARRLRGRSSLADALFPLLWLHPGYAEAWTMAMQLTVAMPTLLVVAAIAAVAGRATVGPARIAFVGACTTLLAFCGGFGWTQAFAWIAWLAWAAVRARREGRASPARAAFVACAVAAVAVLFVAFGLPHASTRAGDGGTSAWKLVVLALQLVSLSAGPIAAESAWIGPVIALAFVVATLAGLVLALRRDRDPWTSSALLAGALGTCALVLAVGLMRQSAWPIGGFATRYMGASTPIVACAALALARFSRGRARIAQAALAIGLACAWPAALRFGRIVGESRMRLTREFRDAVAAGANLDDLAQRFGTRCYTSSMLYKQRLGEMWILRVAPFDVDVPRDPTELDRDAFAALGTRPSRWSSDRPPAHRRVGGRDVLALQAPATLAYALAGGERTLRARYGVPGASYAQAGDAMRTEGVVFRVARVDGGGARRVLWERALDPLRREGDRGLFALEVALDDATQGAELALEVDGIEGRAEAPDWGAWTDVELAR